MHHGYEENDSICAKEILAVCLEMYEEMPLCIDASLATQLVYYCKLGCSIDSCVDSYDGKFSYNNIFIYIYIQDLH